MISFFEGGGIAIGVDYRYTPEEKTIQTVIIRTEKRIFDEGTPEEREEDFAVTEEQETIIPATGRPNCIFFSPLDVPEGKTPLLRETEEGFEVDFVKIK